MKNVEIINSNFIFAGKNARKNHREFYAKKTRLCFIGMFFEDAKYTVAFFKRAKESLASLKNAPKSVGWYD